MVCVVTDLSGLGCRECDSSLKTSIVSFFAQTLVNN